MSPHESGNHSFKMSLEKLKISICTRLARVFGAQSAKTEPESSASNDENHYLRLGWIAIIFFFGVFILWASFAPLDKGVVAMGTVITDGQNKIIQPTDSGIIEEILVRDGDIVKAGQLLVRLNSLQAKAQTAAVQEQMGGINGQILGLEQLLVNLKLQQRLLTEQLTGMRQLAAEGYVARNRVLELERNLAQINGSLAENQGNLDRYRKQLAELEEKLPAVQFNLDNTTIESSVDGSIINLAVFTKGQFVQAGMKLMEVVPADLPLIVEAKVPVELIDKVKVGLPVEMQFTAFNQRITPRIPGELIVVSADRTTEQTSGANDPVYYKVQARVTPKGLRLLSDHQVRPGMPVNVFIVTGERTMMNYILKPLTDRARNALIEE